MVSSRMEYAVPGMETRQPKMVSGRRSSSSRILCTETSKRPSRSTVSVVVSPRSVALKRRTRSVSHFDPRLFQSAYFGKKKGVFWE